MSMIIWLLSALLMLIGSCSQPVGQASTSIQQDLCEVDRKGIFYTVAPGATLSSVAEAAAIPIEILAAANCLDEQDVIEMQETLYIPHIPDPLLTHSSSDGQPTVAGRLEIQPWLTFERPLRIVWTDIPPYLPADTPIELVLVLPDGTQQVVGSTDKIMLHGSRVAWLLWQAPTDAVDQARLFARAGGYASSDIIFVTGAVEVHTFTTDKTSLNPDETATLSWSVSGGTSVSIYSMIGGNVAHALPLEGSITVTAPSEEAEIHSLTYMLFVTIDEGTTYEIMSPPEVEISLVRP